MDIIVINCTVPNKKMAKDITKVLMKHKLAACVSMVENVKSVFSWDGEICEEKEILAHQDEIIEFAAVVVEQQNGEAVILQEYDELVRKTFEE